MKGIPSRVGMTPPQTYQQRCWVWQLQTTHQPPALLSTRVGRLTSIPTKQTTELALPQLTKPMKIQPSLLLPTPSQHPLDIHLAAGALRNLVLEQRVLD